MTRREFWRGRRVFVTGHTGFKGGWSSLLLRELGAEVSGFALPPDDSQGIFCVSGVEREMQHRIGDVRDAGALRAAVEDARPEIIFHMAAQALVQCSYANPVATYATNVMGTVNLLEAVRHAPTVRAVVVVTSDKCYDNVGAVSEYRENDRLGGHDPYSSSKACAELVTSAYRRSFFGNPSSACIASARAGNVIGGGDWAADRLVPDAIRAFAGQFPLRVRNPHAVRPWQHVFDAVAGYLRLAEALYSGDRNFAESWNFGPATHSDLSVAAVVDQLVALWGATPSWEKDQGEHSHEAEYLKLDSTKASHHLGWRPALDLSEALELTVAWYRALVQGADLRTVSLAQIRQFLAREQTPAQAAVA